MRKQNKSEIVISDIYENIARVSFPVADRLDASLIVRSRDGTVSYRYDTSAIREFRDGVEAAEAAYSCSLVQTIVDMFVDLVFHKLYIRHEDPEVEEIFQKAFELSNIESAIEAVLLDYFKYGNAFPYRYYTEGEIDPFDERFDMFEPFGWINLSPSAVGIEGETIDQIEYILEDESIGEGSFGVNEGEFLDKEFIYHIYTKKPVRDKKAIPPLAKIANAALLYKELQENLLDQVQNAVPGLIHAKVAGLNGRAPRPETIAKVTSAIRNSKSGSVIVTSDLVELATVALPEADSNQRIYPLVLQEIENGMGVTRELATSSVQGGGSLQWFNITKLIKTLEVARRKVQKWLNRETKYVTQYLIEQGLLQEGIKTPPVVSIGEVVLRDETRIRDILLKMYEKGMLSNYTCLEEMNFDLQVELNRKALEMTGEIEFEGETLRIQELLSPPIQPFQGQQNDGGRPEGEGTPQEEVNREEE